MTDVLIVQQFEILIINIFGMHIGFIILQVLTIMEVPLAGSQIGPCLKCKLKSLTILPGGMRYDTDPDAEYMQWWFER
jgi:hypothetical protein